MSSLDEIRQTRIKKLEALKKSGVNPYPADSKRELSLGEAAANFDALEKSKEEKWVAGRIMSIRGQGAIIFITLYDGTGSFQGLLKKDVLGEEKLNFWNEVTDIGDFVELRGTFFKTNRGEKTLEARDWRMLSKSLRPLPEKWHGLVDVEERYRRRYLDILMNPELHDLFIKKARFWDATRSFLKKEGFLEVDTPTIEVTTGGAEARPFKTHHNDFDLDVFMRISVGELWQKRLLAAGFPRVFEIGRVYRNEGSSPEHTQEFTGMEFYAGYMDYRQGMEFTEKMIKEVAEATFGTLQFETHGHRVDLSEPWEKIPYVDTVKKMIDIDVLSATEKEMMKKLDELGVKYEGANKERLTDSLWKYCRKQIVGPAWLIDVPKLVSPLSKAKPENPLLTERVQLILTGAEMTNGFSELNDPIDQEERFEVQKKLIEGGDEEAMMPDDEFVEMLEHGMPPAFGFAYGERLFTFLADKPLRETQLFPLMKPEGQRAPAKNKKTMMAVAVLAKDAKMEPWQELNTVAHLTAAFGARVGRGDLFTRDTIATKDDKRIKLNIKNAIMIKTASSGKELKELLSKAKEEKLEVDEFTREMIETTSDKKVVEITASKNFEEIEYLGVLVYGPKDAVEKLTGDFKLY
ncbi:MAG: Lysine-tRNA ligase [Parcubacteria group bacterium GW2011_GWA1_47_10]|uniref:Lysine--tRNA ligase n=1 Tax=Candidatus Nomurabacteria bacterium GW2011_GWB1_47_6 TaxID=1618749 RepID=A0A0G1VBG2_9BACT|nr:MAG: Lysine-tRNA ligase [Parcubacteria group bacterium GW2011_GWA1_47_10]KKU75508.1 MAG: Lysine-tRNA ligase [Candidatus Nomurabacteria bacterium GW2011_GWB1_47_6]